MYDRIGDTRAAAGIMPQELSRTGHVVNVSYDLTCNDYGAGGHTAASMRVIEYRSRNLSDGVE